MKKVVKKKRLKKSGTGKKKNRVKTPSSKKGKRKRPSTTKKRGSRLKGKLGGNLDFGGDQSDVQSLRNKIARAESSLTMLKNSNCALDTEKEALLYELDSMHQKHVEECELLEKRNDELNMKRKTMEEKLNRVDEIEERIINLYLEINALIKKDSEKGDKKDKASSEKRDYVNHFSESERAALKKQNSLIIINKLQFQLRTLFDWKESFENELKEGKQRQKSESERELESIKQNMRDLQAERDEYRSNATRAIQEKNESLHSRKVTIEESNRIMRKLQSDNEKLMDELKKSKNTIKDLKNKLDTRDKILRHREIQLMKITQLESQISKTKLKHKFNQHKIQNEQSKLMKKFESQLKDFNKLKAERVDLKNELTQKKEKIHSLLKDNNRVKVMELLKQKERNEKLTTDLQLEIQKLKEIKDEMSLKISTLKGQSERLKEHNQKILKENITFKQKKTKTENDLLKKKAGVEMKEYEQGSKDDHILQYYKKRLKEKEKEVDRLNKRVRRMILAEHKSNLIRRSSQTDSYEHAHSKRKSSGNNGSSGGGKSKINNIESISEKEKMVEELKEKNKHLEKKISDYEDMKRNLSVNKKKRKVEVGNGYGGNLVSNLIRERKKRSMGKKSSEIRTLV